MSAKYTLLLFLALSCVYTNRAYSFDDKKTHRELTDAATVHSTLISYLVDNVGFNEGLDKKLKGIDRNGHERNNSILSWLQEGSSDEDLPTFCRASNHFHKPIYTGNWAQSQMSDSFTVDAACGTSHRYSNVTWATGFIDPSIDIGPRVGQDRGLSGLYDAPQEMGWDSARTYFYEALTSREPLEKEAKFIKTFRAVGQVMHLLQDMAVPAHVRNDMQSHLWNNLNPFKWGNAFEKYVVNHSDARNKVSDKDKPAFAASPTRLTDFWDTDTYTGETPTAGTNLGLAEYTNANFVSDFTIFKPQSDTKHYFKYPAETSAEKVNMLIPNPFVPSAVVTRKYYVKKRDGDMGYLLAGVGYLPVKVRPVLDTATYEMLPPMDNYVHADYADRLLPRAVGYSAALLDYFFRGKIKLTLANPEDITFRNIKVTAQNDTAGENMGLGDVSLVIRYKALAETSLSGDKWLLSNPSSVDTYKVIKLASQIDLKDPKILTFDLSGEPLPMYFSDMAMQLVFKGKLGNEENAIAVSQLVPIDGVYSDLDLSLPPSGVYAKVSGDSVNGTFNELRVTATTTIPGGLTGGSIMLYLEHTVSKDDPFQSVVVETDPANAAGYFIKVPVSNGVTSLAQGVPTELVFNLSSTPLPVKAADVYLGVAYLKPDGKPAAIGFHDISEPTPVDMFNNTDYSCVAGTWYISGTPEARTAANQAGNKNGFDDDMDTYPHNFTNIFFKASSAATPVNASSTMYDFLEPGPVAPNTKKRLGYILTDYSFTHSFYKTWVHTSAPQDGWTTVSAPATRNTGTGFCNQAGRCFNTMYTIRSRKMWGGAGEVMDNLKTLPGSSCNWSLLPLP